MEELTPAAFPSADELTPSASNFGSKAIQPKRRSTATRENIPSMNLFVKTA
jgi:hypothetical protein